MRSHADILDQPEPLTPPLLASLLLHAGVTGGVLAIGLMGALGHRDIENWGDPNGGGIGSVAVTPVNQIPLPSRGGLVNPVANDTESQVPEPPAPPTKTKPTPKVKEPDPDAIAIRSRNAKMKQRASEAVAAPNKYRSKQVDAPNQLYTRGGQAMSSPMYGMTGGGGVGIGNSSPFGNRFGYYAELLRRRVAEKWSTSDVDPRVRTAPQVIVQFTIRRDGSIPSGSVRIVQRSGVAALDYSAQRAIYDANPVPALPPGFEKSEANIEFVFELRR